jgi:GH141 insertion domain
MLIGRLRSNRWVTLAALFVLELCQDAVRMPLHSQEVSGAAALAPISATQRTFYISPDGSDSNQGTLNGPFLTLQRARAAASAAISDGMTGDIVIYLRGGIYQLDAPLVLGPAESGRNGHRIIFSSYPKEQAIISAGRRIAGWTLHDPAKNIYRSYVGTDWNFRQLYVNGRHAERARKLLNPREFSRTADGYATVTPAQAGWTNLAGLEVVVLGKWMMNRCKVASVTEHRMTMINPCWRNTQWSSQWGADAPSWIENAYEFLDQPGQWYLDHNAGYLYYIPRPEEDLPKSEVVAPFLQDIIVGTFAHDISFTNLLFCQSNWLAPDTPDGYVGLQAGYHKTGPKGSLTPMHSAIHFATSRNIVFQGNTFTQLGSRALTFDRGSQMIVISSNRFVETAAGAMQFGQIDDAGNSDPASQNRTYMVRDNLISDIGFDYLDDAAIVGLYVAQMTVDHNEIGRVPHYGISMGWGWGKVRSYAKDNQVGWNYIHDFSGRFTDSAGIYMLGSLPGTIIHDNYIANGGRGYGCLYPDEGSAYQQWTRNVCENVREWLHIWINSIRYNKVYGNWTNTATMLNRGGPNDISGNVVISDGNWPAAARSVQSEAGVGRETPLSVVE